MQLIECVPNISEGRNYSVIKKITENLSRHKNVAILNIDSGFTVNRTVFTLIGSPDNIFDAVFDLYKTASELIDMQKHSGSHPRIGAVDVCPFIPYREISINECIKLTDDFSEKIANKLNIPVYSYEYSEKKGSYRHKLEQIRKGEYEKLPIKIKESGWEPDFGLPQFNSKSGATVIGVRDFLIAYNINLDSRDLKTASEIASEIRESGNGKDKLQNIKAIGWYIEEFDCVQISTNITNFRETPIHVLWERVEKLAKTKKIKLNGSELVGLIPLEAITETGKYFGIKNNIKLKNEKEIIDTAIEKLGLNSKKRFNASDQIIEYKLSKNNIF